jgi:hypothetical protein
MEEVIIVDQVTVIGRATPITRVSDEKMMEITGHLPEIMFLQIRMEMSFSAINRVKFLRETIDLIVGDRQTIMRQVILAEKQK